MPEKGILESLEFQYVLGNPGDLTVQTFTELKVAGTGYNIQYQTRYLCDSFFYTRRGLSSLVSVPRSKGQLISKCLLGVFNLTKKPTKSF